MMRSFIYTGSQCIFSLSLSRWHAMIINTIITRQRFKCSTPLIHPTLAKCRLYNLEWKLTRYKIYLTIVIACYCESMMEIKIPVVSCGGVFLLHQVTNHHMYLDISVRLWSVSDVYMTKGTHPCSCML